MKALVAYYSLTGNSERAAKAVAGELKKRWHDADVERITPEEKYGKLKAYITGCRQARKKEVIKLMPLRVNFIEFGLFVVINPAWAFTCAPPGYSFVLGLPEARTGQRAIAITMNGGMPGAASQILADVLRKKGYEIAGAFNAQSPEEAAQKVKEIL